MVECDCRDLEREVHADDVHCHGDGERKHLGNGDAFRIKHGEGGSGEDIEREGSDEEMESGECGLTLSKSLVVEDGFVAEDL